MAVLQLLTYPDKNLKRVSKPVEKFDQTLRIFVKDLVKMMDMFANTAGIAAPQVGVLLRIIIVDVSFKKNIKHHGKLILINPEIISTQGKQKGREGCLSVPGFTGNVIRSKTIKLLAYDLNAQRIDIEATGYEARAIQHEIDHLDGLLFLDRLVNVRVDLYQRLL